jgi:hypothetical protein
MLSLRSIAVRSQLQRSKSPVRTTAGVGCAAAAMRPQRPPPVVPARKPHHHSFVRLPARADWPFGVGTPFQRRGRRGQFFGERLDPVSTCDIGVPPSAGQPAGRRESAGQAGLSKSASRPDGGDNDVHAANVLKVSFHLRWSGSHDAFSAAIYSLRTGVQYRGDPPRNKHYAYILRGLNGARSRRRRSIERAERSQQMLEQSPLLIRIEQTISITRAL